MVTGAEMKAYLVKRDAERAEALDVELDEEEEDDDE